MFVYIYIYSFLIGSKKENIIKKGIEGKIHRVHDIEQRANKKKKKKEQKVIKLFYKRQLKIHKSKTIQETPTSRPIKENSLAQI